MISQFKSLIIVIYKVQCHKGSPKCQKSVTYYCNGPLTNTIIVNHRQQKYFFYKNDPSYSRSRILVRFHRRSLSSWTVWVNNVHTSVAMRPVISSSLSGYLRWWRHNQLWFLILSTEYVTDLDRLLFSSWFWQFFNPTSFLRQ